MKKTVKYKDNNIIFDDLLESGHNTDKFVIDGTIYTTPDHDFNHVLKYLKPGNVVYDIGAYIGTYSIPMAIEGMEVHAFEGSNNNIPRLSENVMGYNVSVHPFAVSDVNESVYTKFNDCTDKESKEELISYIKLDDYIRAEKMPNPDLIKLDIEGMETVALIGMGYILEDVRPIWQIEYHKGLEDKYDGYPGFVEVADGGFDFNVFEKLDYVIQENGMCCGNPFSAHTNYVCIPKEKLL